MAFPASPLGARLKRGGEHSKGAGMPGSRAWAGTTAEQERSNVLVLTECDSLGTLRMEFAKKDKKIALRISTS
jgi:hypothetical protein